MLICLNGTSRRIFYDYYVPRVRLDIYKMYISFFSVRVWLQMANDISCADRLDIFKHLCFSNLSEKYTVISLSSYLSSTCFRCKQLSVILTKSTYLLFCYVAINQLLNLIL